MTERSQIHLNLADGVRETIEVTPLGSDCFRLEDTPFWQEDEEAPVYFGDVLELEPQPDGSYRLVRVVERAPLRHWDWIIPKYFWESDHYKEFTKLVANSGGACERLMGGLLYVHLPQTSSLDVENELDRRIASAKGALQK